MSKKPNIQMPMPTVVGIDDPDPQPLKRGSASGWLGNYEWVSLPITEENKYNDKRDIPAYDWCVEQYGEEASRWYKKGDKFYFRSNEDLMMFILRWA